MSDDGQRVSIFIDGEGQMEFLQHARVRDGKITHLAALPGGMIGGRASVAVVGRLKDGSYALLQTSLRLMLNAAAAWLARYGSEADGRPTEPMNDVTRTRLNTAMLLKLVRDREGAEVTFDVAELNAVMQDSAQDIEVQYGADGRSLTIRAARSE